MTALGLTIGQKARRSLRLTRAEVDAYARITGDYNPLHFDERFAAATQFGRLVVHGGLTAGILNALVSGFGMDPVAWIQVSQPVPINTIALIVVGTWMLAGFAMVILSAALRGIPEETIEAAVIDGANPFQIFWKIMIPQIWGTIAVVWTTITILVLKVFDIVLTMTNGQWNTQVLANLMFDWMFRGGGDFGRGATIAIIIMLAVLPIMIWNIRRANAEEGTR